MRISVKNQLKCYETAFKSKVNGQRLQLTPFFLYLLQHLFLGFIQAEEQAELQACLGKEITAFFCISDV